MAQIIDIRRVEVGPRSLTARVRIATTAPLFTSEDLEGTTRVYRLLPHIIEHACLGDTSETFKDVMGDTELAHLLEHVTVELLAQTDIAGDISSGRTFAVEGERRTYDVEIACPDDVLVVGALSSAVWIMQWAYSGGTDPEPDVPATIQGLVGLVKSLPEPEEGDTSVVEYVVSEKEAAQLVAEKAATYEGTEGLEEPNGMEDVAEQFVQEEDFSRIEGVRESPEARQSSQDFPSLNPYAARDLAERMAAREAEYAPVVPASAVPQVIEPVVAPKPDVVQEELIPDAEFEMIEDELGDTAASTPSYRPASGQIADAEYERAPEAPEQAAPAAYEPVREQAPSPEPLPEPAVEPAAYEDPQPARTTESFAAASYRQEVVVEDEPEAEEPVQDKAAPNVSWSTISPAATGEWGTIPEPRFVR